MTLNNIFPTQTEVTNATFAAVKQMFRLPGDFKLTSENFTALTSGLDSTQTINVRILTLKNLGYTTQAAVDMVIGDGTYDALRSLLQM